MNPKGECHQNYRKQNRDFRLEGIESFMRYMEGLLDTLKAKVDMLPKVDGDGNSECPFAESLYAERDELEERVNKALQDASGYMELLDREIARLRGNLRRVQSDGNSLTSAQARNEYGFAAQALKHHIEKSFERRKTLSELIALALKLLGLSSGKRWPLGKPQRGFRPRAIPGGDFTGVSSLGHQSSKPLRFGSSAALRDSALNSLISLGPLNKEGT